MTMYRNMLPRFSIFICLHMLVCSSDAFSSPAQTEKSFWNSEKVQKLVDPPPPELLELIQIEPYRGGLEPAVDVEKYEPKIMSGQIPKDLVGSLAGNGPGRIRVGNRQFGHWFDGDGYVTLIGLDGKSNKVTFQGKYVQTDRFQKQHCYMQTASPEERLSPRLQSSGAWTQRGRGKWFENLAAIPTNPANTATMWLPSGGGDKPRLMALCEGGQPYELDPTNLKTIGREGAVFAAPNKTPDSFFSAHFSRTPNGDILNHGYKLKPGPGQKELNLVRISEQGQLLDQRSTVIPFDTFVHDSTISKAHLVYFLPPWKVPPSAMLNLLTGRDALANMCEWDQKDATYIRVHSQNDLSLQWELKLPSLMSVYHLVDAYEEEQDDGSLLFQVRVAQLDPLDRVLQEAQFADQYRVSEKRLFTKLVEYSFHLEQDGTGELISTKDVASDHAPCEFPTINQEFQNAKDSRARYCWINALSSSSENWLDGLQKVDMVKGDSSSVVSFGAGNYCGPPAFVPADGATKEDEGYLIATVYKSGEHQSDIVILDAASMKVMCRLSLNSHIPYQFHGEYVREFVA